MASNNTISLSLFFTLIILTFTLTSGTEYNPSLNYKQAQSLPSRRTKPSKEKCPINALKLGVCANIISSLFDVHLGIPSYQPCCSVVQGLVAMDAAVCFCTALSADVLGMNINIPITLSVLLDACNTQLPLGFNCA